MPLGTDFIAWNPRIGDTGDDRYNLPPDKTLQAGPRNIYSDPPTLAEIDIGSGINQMIAYTKLMSLIAPGIDPPPSNFIDENDKIDAALLNSIDRGMFIAINQGTATSLTKVVDYFQRLRKNYSFDSLGVPDIPTIEPGGSTPRSRLNELFYSKNGFPPDPSGTFGADHVPLADQNGATAAFFASGGTLRESLRVSRCFKGLVDPEFKIDIDVWTRRVIISPDALGPSVTVRLHISDFADSQLQPAHWTLGPFIGSITKAETVSTPPTQVDTFSFESGLLVNNFSLIIGESNEIDDTPTANTPSRMQTNIRHIIPIFYRI